MEKDWIDELRELCQKLSWKNINEIHSKELEFFINETELAIQLLEEETDPEVQIATFRWKQATVMAHMLKTYIRRFKLDV